MTLTKSQNGSMLFPEQFRTAGHSQHGDPFGVFHIPGSQAKGRRLRVIVMNGEVDGWEHVSVSLRDSPAKLPSYAEMNLVKRTFWEPETCVVEFHPPTSDHISYAEVTGCEVLHLWRCPDVPFPTPPKYAI